MKLSCYVLKFTSGTLYIPKQIDKSDAKFIPQVIKTRTESYVVPQIRYHNIFDAYSYYYTYDTNYRYVDYVEYEDPIFANEYRGYYRVDDATGCLY